MPLRPTLLRFQRWLWKSPEERRSAVESRLAGALQIFVMVSRELAAGHLTLQAMSLIYTTLLSIVPLLAISFSVLKAFGVHNQIEPLLLNFLAPLGEKAEEVTRTIIEFVDNMKAGVLGSVGLLFLIFTVVSLLHKVENTFNTIWHVSRHRPLARRFSDYLSVVLIGPVLVFSAMGVTASLMGTEWMQWASHVEPLGTLIRLLGRLTPYLLLTGAFMFTYIFIPYTRVRPTAAFAGAAVASVLWETSGRLFAAFVVSAGKYQMIYSAFATMIFFMIWLYLSWLILLAGAAIAYYFQHPEARLRHSTNRPLSIRVRERLALLLLLETARAFVEGREPPIPEELASRLDVPVWMLDPIIDGLLEGGLLVKAGDSRGGLLPARSLDTITLDEAMEVIRSSGERRGLPLIHLPGDPALERIEQAWEGAFATAAGHVTLRKLAERR